MAAKKNKILCAKCQLWPVLYTTSMAGQPLKHGICRECYETGAGSGRTTHGTSSSRRTAEQKELTRETKFGKDQG